MNPGCELNVVDDMNNLGSLELRTLEVVNNSRLFMT